MIKLYIGVVLLSVHGSNRWNPVGFLILDPQFEETSMKKQSWRELIQYIPATMGHNPLIHHLLTSVVVVLVFTIKLWLHASFFAVTAYQCSMYMVYLPWFNIVYLHLGELVINGKQCAGIFAMQYLPCD